jgi:uncharacterized protein YlxP (DUF503 family)
MKAVSRPSGHRSGRCPGGVACPFGQLTAGATLRGVFTATAVFDMLLPDDSRSLKAKRSYVRPILAALRRFEVAAAEVGALDLHRRAEIGVAAVGADAAHVRAVLDSCEQLVAGRPEVELLSARRRLHGDDD